MTYSVNRRVVRATRRAVAATAVAATVFAIPAHAQTELTDVTSSLDPSTEAGLEVWENTQARSTDPELGISLALSSLDVTSDHATATVEVRNDSPATASELNLRVMWQPTATSASGIRTAQLANYGEYSSGSAAVALPDSVTPGESANFTVSISTDNRTATTADAKVITPQLFEPGSHPIMFALSGTVQGPEQQQPAPQLAAVARTTLHVASDKEDEQPPSNLTFLWPLAAETNVLGGGMGSAPTRAPLYLRNEELAGELGEGGRLRVLLDTYREAIDGPQGSEIKQASCLAIDPELLDTVERMTGGYRVGTTRPAPVEEPKRLRDSWGELLGDEDGGSVAGSGMDVARAWLDDLRALVNEGCSVALPYAGADINTIAATGEDWLGVHAFGQGPQIIHRVLGVWPMQNVVIPDAGYVAPEATRLLAAGATQGRQSDLSERFERIQGGAPVFPKDAEVTTIVAENSVISGTPAPQEDPEAPRRAPLVDLSGSLPQREGSDHKAQALAFSGNVGTVLRATGTRPEIAAYSNPAQRYDLAADSSLARMLDATAVMNEEIAAGEPVLAVPPALWSVGKKDAALFLESMADALDSGRAVATPLSNLLRGDAAEGRTTVPYTDHGVHSEALTTKVRDHANALRELTLTMRNDPAIALSREAFTRPLYDDLTRAASGYRMRERAAFGQVRAAVAKRTETVGKVISALRDSISLLPPGNVFTRTSDSSPLLVVARNGLPLPVPVTIDYTTGGAAQIDLETPNATETLPAKGSLTVSIRTTIEQDEDTRGTTDVRLWLASPAGEAISKSVDVRVQSAPGISAGTAAVLLTLLAGIGVLGKFLWDRRSGRKSPLLGRRRQAHPEHLDLGRSASED